MKRILVLLLAGMLYSKAGMALNYFTSAYGSSTTSNAIAYFHEYPASSSITSSNGKFQVIMQSSGYLELLENTNYGLMKRWQFPNPGEGIPGTKLFLVEKRDVGNPTSYVWASIGVSWDSPFAKKITADFHTIGGIIMNLTNDGNISLVAYGSVIAPFFSFWTSNTSENQPSTNAWLPAYTRNGNDLTVHSLFNDEALSTHFTMGNIYFPGSRVVQNVNPVKFVADGFIELQPGFSTEMTGNGALIIEGMRHVVNGTPPSSARSNTLRNQESDETPVQEEETYKGAKVILVPNPTTGLLNIQLANPDDKVLYVKLFDNSGKLLAEFRSVRTINIGNFAAGVYYFQLETIKEGIHKGKIVKQ